MHILQLSETLPDRRVEKTIRSDIKLGNKISYIGLHVKDPEKFLNVHTFNLTLKDALFNLKKFRKKIAPLISEIDPDLIHAHDILLGSAAVNQGYPVVYNDHEYHSKKEWTNNPLATPWTKMFIKRKFTWPYRYLTFRTREKKLLSNAAVIVANENVAREHRKTGSSVYVMPNYPEKDEVANVWEKAKNYEKEFDGVYVGNDMTRKSTPYRQANQSYSSLRKRFSLLVIGDKTLQSTGKIVSTGYLHHDEIYNHVMRARTGLLSWKPHYFHPYCSPNKLSFYIHAGAIPIIPYTLEQPNLEHCLKFKRTSQIPELIEKAKNEIDRNDVLNEAKNFLWDKYQNQLKEANEKALTL